MFYIMCVYKNLHFVSSGMLTSKILAEKAFKACPLTLLLALAVISNLEKLLVFFHQQCSIAHKIKDGDILSFEVCTISLLVMLKGTWQ
jgi:hypothetical protein